MNTLSSLLYFLGENVFPKTATKTKFANLGWTDPGTESRDSILSFTADKIGETMQSASLTSQTLGANTWKDFSISVTAPAGIGNNRLVIVRAWDIGGTGSTLVAPNGITTSKARVNSGETFTVHVKARNYGSAETTGLSITVYLAYL